MKAIGQIYSIRSCFFTSLVHHPTIRENPSFMDAAKPRIRRERRGSKIIYFRCCSSTARSDQQHSTLNKIRSHNHHNTRSKLINQLLSSNQHFRYSLYSAKKGFTASPASVAALNQFASNSTLHQQQDQPSLHIGCCYPTSAHGGTLHNRYQNPSAHHQHQWLVRPGGNISSFSTPTGSSTTRQQHMCKSSSSCRTMSAGMQYYQNRKTGRTALQATQGTFQQHHVAIFN
ncbi:hypothetical protein Nepgr_029676 [Nepenthes gracilis]|uniref:Uncharacterized protein n=1 Tax=Nepenthes gracilis TaxID=150966 RepID=A0AAD3TEP6_NEPGR|nr:hypothetical protein Nepgr_029676 [Nepenthes gracilis]